MNLPEMNNEKLNNAFHYLVMHPVAYLIGLGCAAEQYTPDGRYFGFPTVMLIGLAALGGAIEGLVKLVMNSRFDKKDVLRYGIGGLLGGITYALYPGHNWVLWASGIPAAIVSILTLAHYWKVKKNQ